MSAYSDLGKKYRNPIIFADYSDPDVIRVGDTFYMTASSFNYTPGLPILVSKDLVNWKLVNYALKNIGQERFKIPRHSEGVWAPAIRYHDGMFYIYYGMPDEGFFVVRSADPLGEWEEPVCILKGKGLIDSCPFWDEDGKAYVVHGYAKSRIGFKSILGIFEMSPDGLSATGEDHFIFNGNDPAHPAVTIEGPKVYKRDGYYYIWAPAGGVREGYQVVLRSKDIRGSYEIRTILESGVTVINGPHQGGLTDTINGDEWFVHFQDRGLYGRICHLQPVRWTDGWPVAGAVKDDSKCNKGEPVYEWEKPDCENRGVCSSDPYFPYFGKCNIYRLPEDVLNSETEYELQASDSFPGGRIGLFWQWMGDHEESFFGKVTDKEGNVKDGLRLFCLNPSGDLNPIIWRSSNVLTQKLIYPVFVARINLDISGLLESERAGVVMTGGQYVTAFIEKRDGCCYVCTAQSDGSDDDKKELLISSIALSDLLKTKEAVSRLCFRLKFTYRNRNFDSKALYYQNANSPMFGVNPGLSIELGAISDEEGCRDFHDLEVDFTPSDHTWVGAKIGIYASGHGCSSSDCGYADFMSVNVMEL